MPVGHLNTAPTQPKPRDFRQRSFFPGTNGNPFDVILHRYTKVERLPSILFAVLLGLLALLPFQGQWLFKGVLWFTFLGDWALLAYLPRFHRSFGPAKPTVLLLAAFRLIPALFSPMVALPIELFGTLLVVYGFWIEPQRLTLTRQVFRSPKFRPRTPLRVLHIGDLHIERVTRREQRLNKIILETQPDLILFSGDFINLSFLDDPQAWRAAHDLMKEWKAQLGIYVVSGSPAVDLPGIIPAILAELPVHWLQNEQVHINYQGQDLNLFGVSCSHKPFEDAPILERMVAKKSKALNVLLYHSPDLAPDAASLGIDLQLSGHTHGGQVRLPGIGAIYTGSLYGRTFTSGRMQIGSLTLYITRGLGLEGAAAPRVRFLCPPEVTLWEIG
ncbi:MAG: metallophosphoesterase [Anaerolineaceae bacterium]|nr:metallophosphoesterase [Anaerolineaceae bacterium]